jgi:hypothetical protein
VSTPTCTVGIGFTRCTASAAPGRVAGESPSSRRPPPRWAAPLTLGTDSASIAEANPRGLRRPRGSWWCRWRPAPVRRGRVRRRPGSACANLEVIQRNCALAWCSVVVCPSMSRLSAARLGCPCSRATARWASLRALRVGNSPRTAASAAHARDGFCSPPTAGLSVRRARLGSSRGAGLCAERSRTCVNGLKRIRADLRKSCFCRSARYVVLGSHLWVLPSVLNGL